MDDEDLTPIGSLVAVLIVVIICAIAWYHHYQQHKIFLSDCQQHGLPYFECEEQWRRGENS